MASVAVSYETLSDVELARRIAQRDSMAARVVIKRNNQRLYRAAWSVLKDRSEAEEAVQDGYLKAFAAIEGFAGKSSLSTWLTRIVLNEALGRRRSTQRSSCPGPGPLLFVGRRQGRSRLPEVLTCCCPAGRSRIRSATREHARSDRPTCRDPLGLNLGGLDKLATKLTGLGRDPPVQHRAAPARPRRYRRPDRRPARGGGRSSSQPRLRAAIARDLSAL